MSEIRCPNCHLVPAKRHPVLGVLPCDRCNKRQTKFTKPGSQVEFTTTSIKLQRAEYGDDIEQTHYKGQLNKKWVDIYGPAEAKKRGFSDKEIAEAKYVFDGAGVRYYNDAT